MKYLKRYESFINDAISNVNYDVNKNIIIVEKQILNDFSVSFWDLSLNSSVFTDEEKSFIKENLTSIKVDLVNEGWLSDTLSNVWNRAKEEGGKVWDKIKNKISIIKKFIVKIVADIAKFIISMFKSIGNSILSKSQKLKEQNKDKFTQAVKSALSKKPNAIELKNEIQQLKATFEHLSTSIKAGIFSNKINNIDDNIIKDAESQVGELETELKAESLNYDILKYFYIKEELEENIYKVGDLVRYKTKDGKEVDKKITKIEGDNFYFTDKEGNEFFKTKEDIIKKISSVEKAWGGFVKWFLDMEQATPPVKGKPVWWIKFILKIISLFLSPIVKGLETAAKFATSKVLKAASIASKYLSGPGVYDFLILSGIIAGMGGLIVEFKLVSHSMPEPYSHLFEVIGLFISELTGIKSLLLIFGSFCTVITLYQLIVEFKHLFGGEHSKGHEGENTENQEGEQNITTT